MDHDYKNVPYIYTSGPTEVRSSLDIGERVAAALNRVYPQFPGEPAVKYYVQPSPGGVFGDVFRDSPYSEKDIPKPDAAAIMVVGQDFFNTATKTFANKFFYTNKLVAQYSYR